MALPTVAGDLPESLRKEDLNVAFIDVGATQHSATASKPPWMLRTYPKTGITCNKAVVSAWFWDRFYANRNEQQVKPPPSTGDKPVVSLGTVGDGVFRREWPTIVIKGMGSRHATDSVIKRLSSLYDVPGERRVGAIRGQLPTPLERPLSW
jgi:hypothetical protein